MFVRVRRQDVPSGFQPLDIDKNNMEDFMIVRPTKDDLGYVAQYKAWCKIIHDERE